MSVSIGTEGPPQEQRREERDGIVLLLKKLLYIALSCISFQLIFVFSLASQCIVIRKDSTRCTNKAVDGFQTCRIPSHRQQDPAQEKGVEEVEIDKGQDGTEGL